MNKYTNYVYALITVCVLIIIFAPLYSYAEADYSNSVSEFEVAPCFTDNMIFQQNEPIRIWGTSTDEGKKVNVIFEDSMGSAVVKNGKWELSLAPRVYSSKARTIEIFGNADCEYVSYDNITIGDVWLFIGQSNMEFTTGTVTEDYVEFSASLTGDENIKTLRIPASGFNRNTRWQSLSKYSAYSASALACYTAKNINDAISGEIPIGVVSMGYRGREIESFMKGDKPREKREIYDNVLSYIERMPIAGIVWYQGEADAAHFDLYEEKMTSFIQYQRKVKNQDNRDFPVYVVELSPCFDDPGDPNRQYINFGAVRGAAGTLTSKIKNYYICPTSDTWKQRDYSNNLHPLNKKDIAKRLALMLQAKEYELWPCEYYFPPIIRKYSYGSDNTELFIDFDYAVSGMKTVDEKDLRGFNIIDNMWNSIDDAIIELADEDTLRIKADREICIVRYGCETDDVFGEDTNLCNSHGTPATAFLITMKTPDGKSTDNTQTGKIKLLISYAKRLFLPAISFTIIILFIYFGSQHNKRRGRK